MIRFSADSIEMPVLDERQTGRWIKAVAADYGFSVGNINYIFCSDERELEVNRQFAGQTLNGDIFISLDTVRSNAEQLGIDFEDELKRILIHGVLHLTGQGDKTPESKEQMTRKENLALEKLKKTP